MELWLATLWEDQMVVNLAISIEYMRETEMEYWMASQ